MHGQVMRQVLEFVGAGHKVGLAIQFHQHADLSAGVNVGADDAFQGGAALPLLGGGQALLAQKILRARHVSLGLGERGLAITPGRAGSLPQFFHLLC